MKPKPGTKSFSDKIEHSDPLELSEKQNLALMEIFKGVTDKEAAKVAGVERSTVTGWRNNHPAFRAALRNKRAEIWHETLKPMRDAIAAAFLTINKSIAEGDIQSAWRLLEKIGIDEILKNEFNEMRVEPTTKELEAERIKERDIRQIKEEEGEIERELERMAVQMADEELKKSGGGDLLDDPFGEKKKKLTRALFSHLKEEYADKLRSA